MALKGSNSILFDFDSIIDIEISLIKLFANQYKDHTMLNDLIDKEFIACTDDNTLKFKRVHGEEDLFKSILNPKYKDRYRDLILSFFERDQKDIFDNGYAFNTAMIILINAYKKAGHGIIKTAIRCDNYMQQDYIKSIIPDAVTIVDQRKNIQTEKYGRIIVGHYSSALEYTFREPKSIVVLNYRENFDINDSTLLNPELVIRLGDIHSIEVISSYQENN